MQRPKKAKPPAEMTDKQILARMNKLIDWFYDLAKGDPFGWDWPTMNVLEPELCGEYRQLKAEAVARLDRTGGKFNGEQYIKLEGAWCAPPK